MDEIVTTLLEEYDIDRETLMTDAKHFLEDLKTMHFYEFSSLDSTSPILTPAIKPEYS